MSNGFFSMSNTLIGLEEDLETGRKMITAAADPERAKQACDDLQEALNKLRKDGILSRHLNVEEWNKVGIIWAGMLGATSPPEPEPDFEEYSDPHYDLYDY